MSQRRRRETTYFTHAGNPVEMTRLKRQSAAIGAGAGGTLPGFDVSRIQDVLDLACGTGEWALRVAREYPHMQVRGVDISDLMVRYAQAQAESDDLPARFDVMNILQFPLPFDDASFDLINIRMIFSFMKREMWIPLLRECHRILRPGGHLRSTESETVICNDSRVRLYTRWWMEAFHAAGNTFALTADGTSDLSCPYYCVPLEMPNLMNASGYVDIVRRPFNVDFSSGDTYVSLMDDLFLSFQTGGNFLMKYASVSEDEMKQARTYVEERQKEPPPGFQGYWHMSSVIGRKPG